ncbi:hypothetical protein [Roseateles sp.]|uniref:hypothetical protein n=1 Tax=Roseateles sp. TaxID=1971397 RepID=UPI00286AAD6F|nr:hypothetical protein [Roseateles sp.]
MRSHINPRAGQPASANDLINVNQLIAADYAERPDPGGARSTGGLRHFGSPQLGCRDLAFNEWHVLAIEKLTSAAGNGAPIGGIKVCTASAKFAARPSGTEDIDKIYAESFRDPAHLQALLRRARALVDAAITRRETLAVRAPARPAFKRQRPHQT